MGWFEQYCNDKEFAIREFAVRNTGRGKGIGSKLYSEFEDRMLKASVKKITLLTLRGDLTERFYKKNGFQVSDAIVQMEKIFSKNNKLQFVDELLDCILLS